MSQEAVFHAKAVNSEHSEGERVPVAFSGGQKMIFYMTTYNPGGHYDPKTGVYTCPISGSYMFTFCVYAKKTDGNPDTYANAILVKEGVDDYSEARFYSWDEQDVGSSVSNSVTIHCNTGEKVWIKSLHDGVVLYNWVTLNTFSGFLISADIF